jgi:hypothetical protein
MGVASTAGKGRSEPDRHKRIDLPNLRSPTMGKIEIELI